MKIARVTITTHRTINLGESFKVEVNCMVEDTIGPLLSEYDQEYRHLTNALNYAIDTANWLVKGKFNAVSVWHDKHQAYYCSRMVSLQP